jgi:hypothetical protein
LEGIQYNPLTKEGLYYREKLRPPLGSWPGRSISLLIVPEERREREDSEKDIHSFLSKEALLPPHFV